MRPRSRAVVLLTLAALAGCRDSSTGPAPPSLELTVSGWLERGAMVRLDVRSGSDPVAPDRVRWTAEPASAVEFLAGGLARLLETGTVDITARRDVRTATSSVTVGLPPSILFDDRVAGNRDIFRVRLDGSERERITDDPADDADPTAGGGVVVFSSLRDGNTELYRIAVGDTATRLTTTPDAEERQPALSRDGADLAFARTGAGTERVWTRSMSNGDELRVTDGLAAESTVEVSPSWSPEADRLALTSIARGEADIWTVTATGSDASLLVGAPTAEVEPAWHPSAEKVVYAAVAGNGDGDLFLADLVEETVTRITTRTGSDGQPAWLPDGRIVFTAWTESGTTLMWLDPADPDLVHRIPLQDSAPRNPFGIY